MARILVTGGNGYLGGDLLAEMRKDSRYDDLTVFTSVRKQELWPHFKKMGYEPVSINLDDPEDIKNFIKTNKINIIAEMTDAATDRTAVPAIEALEEVGGTYIASNGTKQWSVFSGFDPNVTLYDDDPNFVEIMRESTKTADEYPTYLRTSAKAVDHMLALGEEKNVGVQIICPCMIYGPSQTIGNPISIQITALVRIAKACGKLFTIPHPNDPHEQIWVQCHIKDCVSLYKLVLDHAVDGKKVDSGVYFAENGYFSWKKLCEGVLKGLDLPLDMPEATQEDFETMAKVLNCRVEEVAAQISGRVNVEGRRGRKIGWKPEYDVDYLYSKVEEEAKFVAEHT